jgi:two-component system OmpR family response regulator
VVTTSVNTHAAPSRILVVEDEPSISDVISTALRFQGHAITQTDNGNRAVALAADAAFDLVVLDVMLPGIDGFEVCRQLRRSNDLSPVLFLTARDEPQNRIQGFMVGGDDYLTKPFSVDELVLRVAAILRRAGRVGSADMLSVADLTLDETGQEVRRAGVLIDLSPTQFRLLHYMMINAGVVLSKAQILVNVWDYEYDGSDNIVELYIGYLRRKIDDGNAPLIHTRRGAGYVLREEPR